MKQLVKIGFWLAGYSSLGLGLLLFSLAAKLLMDVLPELFMAQCLGTVLIIIGFWLLGQHNKLSEGRSIWR